MDINNKSNIYKRILPISWYFVFLGVIGGNWISRIPDIKENNHFSNTTLGIALLFGAIGAICSLPIIAWLNRVLGSAKSLLIGSIQICVMLPFLGLKHAGMKIIIPVLLLIGSGMAITDVSMTTQGVTCEKLENIKKMGFFGASSACGNFVGVLIGGLFAYLGISTFHHFFVIGVVCCAISVGCFFFLYSQADENSIDESYRQSELNNEQLGNTKTLSDSTRRNYIAYMAIIGFLLQICEGTVSDWSGIYFQDSLNCSTLIRSIAFATFVFFLTLGKFFVDHLCTVMDREILLKGGAIVATLGLSILVLSPSLPHSVYIAIVGMSLIGTGLSVPLPIIGSATGDVPGVRPSDVISTVTSVSYLGFLIGPPLFGTLADVLHDLRWSLAIAISLIALVPILPGHLPIQRHKIDSTNDHVYDRLLNSDSAVNRTEKDITSNSSIYDAETLV